MTNLASYYFLAAAAAFRQDPPEIVVAETDPPLLGALGAILKRRWGCRLVFNVRDLYPDIAIANRGVQNPLLLGLLERSNRFAYASADRIIVLGQDMAQRLIAKDVAAERVVVVPDWVDCERIRPLESNPFRTEFGDKFVVMYSGNLGLSQQLETVLDAADRLRDDPRVVFVFIGDGARKEALMAQARALALSNTLFLPYRPKSKLAESLGAADLHLVPQLSGTAGCMVPSKIYGILGAGRPFVAITDEDAEVARIARDYSVGFVIPPGSGPALADAIRSALKSPTELKAMGQRARRLASEHFDRRRVTRRFAEVLEEVARAPVQPTPSLKGAT